MKPEKIVIYQILPRLFGNRKNQNRPNGSLEENGSGKMSAFTPRVLNEIRQMGFTHIWYTGMVEHATKTDYSAYSIRRDHPAVVKGNAGSPYAIKDYYDIDPDLADNIPNRMKEFEELVNRTHEAGLKVIIDFVPNHVAREYYSDSKPKGIVDLGEDDNIHTSYAVNNNFYYIPGQSFAPAFPLDQEGGASYHEYPAKATGNDCFSAHPGLNDWYETVKLNYGIDFLNGGATHFDPVPDTWVKMREILSFWASKDIDAFRCDMAEMVPVEFWEWVIPSIRENFPEILFIAEVYNPELYRSYLGRGCFDYLYNKVGLYDTLRAVICGKQPAHAITGCWQAVDDIHPRMLNFLENHDEQRIASEFFAANPWRAIPALVVAATMNTNPFMVYAGQELGEPGMDAEGFSGRNGRTSIFDYWSVGSLRNWYNDGKVDTGLLTEGQQMLRNIYIQILRLCNSSAAIREGLFYDLMYVNPAGPFFNPERQYVYMRKGVNELLLIVANFEEQNRNLRVFIPAHLFDYFKLDLPKLGSATDLLTGDKIEGLLLPDSWFSMEVKGSNARILKFSLKK